MSKYENISKVRWACRRGMLELDRLLLPFVNHAFSTLARNEQIQFERLLQYNDQDLYRWFMRCEVIPDAALASLIDKILDYAHRQTKIEII